jgi:hypothetical protein
LILELATVSDGAVSGHPLTLERMCLPSLVLIVVIAEGWFDSVENCLDLLATQFGRFDMNL